MKLKPFAITAAAVIVGVIGAGFIMSQLSDVDFIRKAHDGFDG